MNVNEEPVPGKEVPLDPNALDNNARAALRDRLAQGEFFKNTKTPAEAAGVSSSLPPDLKQALEADQTAPSHENSLPDISGTPETGEPGPSGT